MSNRFLAAKGTPARGPGSSPAEILRSTCAASESARSVVTAVKQFRLASELLMRSRAARVSSTALTVPHLTAADNSTTPDSSKLPLMAGTPERLPHPDRVE